ncbi:hypothetical protein J3R82DRAFT_9837 [Butyriboletus roseoflavus]|nr:hypothetical protein J3R82DRAFT_9837 [Butyriboletus roseoflavus]
MAPTPIEDIDFSELCDKILEVLRALWTFMSDLCLALWSYVSQAFWVVWTYPPFETFRNDFMVALIALKDYAIAHPFTTIAIAVLAYIFVPVVLNTLKRALLHCGGFRKRGVLRGIVSFTPAFPWRIVFWLTTGSRGWFYYYYIPRLLCRQLSINEIRWERAEELNVCTVSITRGEGRWHGVSQLGLVVVDLVGIYPFSLVLYRGAARVAHRLINDLYVYWSWVCLYAPAIFTINLIDLEAMTRVVSKSSQV